MSDYPTWDCSKTGQIFSEWVGHKTESLMKFRDQVHESVHGSGMGEKNTVKWWDLFDDGYAAYVNP